MPKESLRAARRDYVRIELDRTSDTPLYHQLCEQLRQMILDQRLQPGARISSSRLLADELGCSRHTTAGAYEQLIAEGLLESAPRSGTRVARNLPRGWTNRPLAPLEATGASYPATRLSARGQALCDRLLPPLVHHDAFTTRRNDYFSFPSDAFVQIARRVWAEPDKLLAAQQEFGDPAGNPFTLGGYMPLRRQIANLLNGYWGMRTDPENIVIGSSNTLRDMHFLTSVLLDPGDAVWLMEPRFVTLGLVMEAAGVRTVPVPADEWGLDVAAGRERAMGARMVAVDAESQYPLGVEMPVERRHQLLAWAREADAWILESASDSPVQIDQPALPALQAMDPNRVISLGSLDELMPSPFSVSYIVVPKALHARLARCLTMFGQDNQYVQPVVAEFLREGHYSVLMQRRRRDLALRVKSLRAAVERHLGDWVVPQARTRSSMLPVFFRPEFAARVQDVDVSRRAHEVGISVRALSEHYVQDAPRQGLLLGCGALVERAIEPAVLGLKSVLADALARAEAAR